MYAHLYCLYIFHISFPILRPAPPLARCFAAAGPSGPSSRPYSHSATHIHIYLCIFQIYVCIDVHIYFTYIFYIYPLPSCKVLCCCGAKQVIFQAVLALCNPYTYILCIFQIYVCIDVHIYFTHIFFIYPLPSCKVLCCCGAKQAILQAVLALCNPYIDSPSIYIYIYTYIVCTYSIYPLPACKVLCCCGAKQAILQAVLALCNPGDEVLVPAPYWPSHLGIPQLCGVTPVVVQTRAAEGYCLQPADLESAITPSTRMLILCNPSNPTGARVFVCIVVCMSLWVCLWVWVCAFVCACVCVCVSIYIYTYAYICVRMYMLVYLYISIYIYLSLYIIYICIYPSWCKRVSPRATAFSPLTWRPPSRHRRACSFCASLQTRPVRVGCVCVCLSV